MNSKIKCNKALFILILLFVFLLSSCKNSNMPANNSGSNNIVVQDNQVENNTVVQDNQVENNTVVQDNQVENNTVVDVDNALEINEFENNENNFSENDSTLSVSGDIYVKFINVGQADSCVIVTPHNDVILIDAGEKKDASQVIDGLSEYEFDDIDLMILSHPHSDHIGGAQTVLNTYDVKEVLMCSFVPTTKLFGNLISTLEDLTETKVTQAELGLTYDIDGVQLEVVGTDSISKDNNNSSVAMKVTYGEVKMLYMGDAETPAEEIIMKNGFDLDSDVLKMGHHGSDTSSSEEFLDVVNPKLAIISVGEGNKYGHPADITLQKLKDRDIQYYRTDECGSVVLEIDGENITVVLDDDYMANNFNASSSFLFVPNVAEVELKPEEDVLEEILNNLNEEN